MTEGSLQDIEELGTTVVLCPWHTYMVNISDGRKVFLGVELDTTGKPISQPKWKKGKVVQRTHEVWEDQHGTYVRLASAEEMMQQSCTSDADASKITCGRAFMIHSFCPVRL